ncbi:hypothetical protein [Pleurocapsa sp. FMAR1]|nr:hypothetical protein [Pleurocapsa sp. FMAR1]
MSSVYAGIPRPISPHILRPHKVTNTYGDRIIKYCQENKLKFLGDRTMPV